MNPVEWLFRDTDLREKEEQLDRHLNRLREKVKSSGSSMLVQVDTDFPKEFTKLSNKISSGHIEWRDFYSNRTLDIYSVHCRMDEGAMLKEHRHPIFDEYIYVISGSIINWMHSDSQGKIITPAEEADDKEDNIKSWHKIPAGISHRIQSMEKDTHFISKFIKPDV
mgnify:CR=1 FL=1